MSISTPGSEDHCPRLSTETELPFYMRWIEMEEGQPSIQGRTVSPMLINPPGPGESFRQISYCGQLGDRIRTRNTNRAALEGFCTTDKHKDCPVRHALEDTAVRTLRELRDLIATKRSS